MCMYMHVYVHVIACAYVHVCVYVCFCGVEWLCILCTYCAHVYLQMCSYAYVYNIRVENHICRFIAFSCLSIRACVYISIFIHVCICLCRPIHAFARICLLVKVDRYSITYAIKTVYLSSCVTCAAISLVCVYI